LLKSVIISGPPAIGKTTVAKGLANEFNFKHLSGGDILKEMAEEEGFSSKGDDWWDTQDGMNFLNKRKTNPDFDKKVDEKLQEYFHQGNVVITSYTLPCLDSEDDFSCILVAAKRCFLLSSKSPSKKLHIAKFTPAIKPKLSASI